MSRQTRPTWSQRWRAVLDDAGPQIGRRVHQGRAYERSGRVTDLRVRPGVLSGRVQGSRATPHLVDIVVPTLPREAWEQVVAAAAGQVRHSARLLARQAPEGLDAELDAAGIHLFPRAEDLAVTCPCGDAVSPCAHAAAIWETVARRLDDDPFLLLRLRGRGRERLLADLASARRRSGARPTADTVAVSALAADGWHRARAPLDGIELPTVPTAATLRMLGDPPGWRGGVDVWGLFGPLVERGAARARALVEDADADRDGADRDEADRYGGSERR